MTKFKLHIACLLGFLSLNACHLLFDKDIRPDATGDLQKMIFPKCFDYKAVNIAYLKFVEWAQSQGSVFNDWYLDKTGHRNDQYILIHISIRSYENSSGNYRR